MSPIRSDRPTCTERPLITAAILILALGPFATTPSLGQAVKLVVREPDPHGSPRPFRDAHDVPLRTSLYLELANPPGSKAGEVNPDVGRRQPDSRTAARPSSCSGPADGSRRAARDG